MKTDYSEAGFIEYIRETALKSILFEAAATPKPGLVDRSNRGAHSDMDFFTFMASSAALSGIFAECAEEGLKYASTDYPGLLQIIRPAGIEAEERMFKATGGVNTHKGLIFSLGIISAAAGSIYRQKRNVAINSEAVCSRVKEIATGISERELGTLDNRMPMTTGERLYMQHGVKGIRGQVESGFSTVVEVSLTVFKEMLRQSSISLNDALVQVLLHLMTVTEDSNVIGRHGIGMLDYVRGCAGKALGLGGMLTPAGREYVAQMDRNFIAKGISPGGSADLLAVTIMLYLLENGGKI